MAEDVNQIQITYDGGFRYPAAEEFANFDKQMAFHSNYKKQIGDEQYEKEYQDYKKTLNPEDETAELLSPDDPESEIRNDFMWRIIEEKMPKESQESPFDKYCRETEDRNAEYLKSIFDSVILVRGKSYPYPERYGRKNYYILTGPKSEVLI